MDMKRITRWMGLAVVAGFLGMAGSASAITMGDFTTDADGNDANAGKLIPYYMAGENLATIIGIQNEALPVDVNTPEFSIIEVRVLDKMGMVQTTGRLCLAQNEFGWATLTEKMMMDDVDMDSMVVLKVGVHGKPVQTHTGMPGAEGSRVAGSDAMPGEGSGIASMGYVVLTDLGTYTMGATATPDNDQDDGCNSAGEPMARDLATNTNNGSKFTAWAILQDVGDMSYFGTEIPTLTVHTGDVLMNATNPANIAPDMDRIACGTDPNGAGDGDETDVGDDCVGLIEPPADDTTEKMVTVRFDSNMDNMSESMIYVWANNHVTYQGGSGMRSERKIDATVYCEGAPMKKMRLDIPDRVNVIDGDVFECEARGTAMLKLLSVATGVDAAGNPDTVKPTAVAVWSHILQEGGGFRMNFLGME